MIDSIHNHNGRWFLIPSRFAYIVTYLHVFNYSVLLFFEEHNGGLYSFADAELICEELNMVPAILSRALDLSAARGITGTTYYT